VGHTESNKGKAELRFQSTKKYLHSLGLSACFRQWRAESHCHYLHGYSLQIELVFGAVELDVRNWVVDFGSLGDIKQYLVDTFDHKTIVASDDPELTYLKEGQKRGVLQLTILEAVGCEKFAEHIYRVVEEWLFYAGYSTRCFLESVEVKEHEGNSAKVIRK